MSSDNRPKYDPFSNEESPELLGVITGFVADSAFVHVLDRGFSAMAFNPLNRGLALGDFAVVKVRRNPDSQPGHRSKHRVVSLFKVRCPRCVKRIGDGKHLVLKVAVRPIEEVPDALVLYDDMLGTVIDNRGKVPRDCLRMPNRLVVVTVRPVVSPKDPDSSILAVDQFVGYEDPECDQRASSSTGGHMGCIWDYRNDTFFVWSDAFDKELELSPKHFERSRKPDRGSWIKFGTPYQTDSNSLEIQDFDFVDNFLPTRRERSHFEVKMKCEYQDKRNRDGAFLFKSPVFSEIVDTQGIISDSELNMFPMELWLTPCISSKSWEVSRENTDLIQQRHTADRVEKTGLIVSDDKNYFVWSSHYKEDLILRKETVRNMSPAVGKWIRFRDITYAVGRVIIVGEVEIIPDVVPTRMNSNAPELLVSCSSLAEDDSGHHAFHSKEVGGVLDLFSVVKDPRNVTLPFTVWAAYQKGREFRCRWRINNLAPQESRTPQPFASNHSNDQGNNYADCKKEMTGFIVYEDVNDANNCYIWSPQHDKDLILRRESLKNEANVLGKWVRFRDVMGSYGRFVILGEVEVIPNVMHTRLNSNVPELRVSCQSVTKDDVGRPVFSSNDVGDIIDVHSIVKDPWNAGFPFTVWVCNKKEEHGCRWKISSNNTPITRPSSSYRMEQQTSSHSQSFPSENPNYGGEYMDNRAEKTGLIVYEDVGNTCYVFCSQYNEDLILRKDTLKDQSILLGKWVRFRDVSNSTGRYVIIGNAEIIPNVVHTRIKYNVPEVNISCTSLMGFDGRFPVFYSDDVGDVVDVNDIVKDPRSVKLPFSVWAVKQKTTDSRCRWKVSSQNTPIASPVPSSSRVTPHLSPSQAFANMYLDDGGKYTDDEDESPCSTVSSCAVEPPPSVTSPAPSAAQIPDGNDADVNKYDGKSLLDLISMALESNNISDAIRREDEDLHAALVNAIFSSDSPPE